MTTTQMFRDAEDAYFDVTGKIAMLTLFTKALSYATFGGTNVELEHDAWRGVQGVLESIRKDVGTIHAAALVGPDAETVPR